TLNYKLGYYIRKSTLSYYDMYNTKLSSGVNTEFSRRWQKPGDEQHTTVPSMLEYGENNFRDRFYNGSVDNIASGDHIRLQDISLSYDLDMLNWKKIPVKHVQLYLYANNIGIIWKANNIGLDPDVVSGRAEEFIGPLPRSFSLGLRTNF
ncbi:MAG TPA: hypothetical protein VKB19_13330, partial [Pedobacter sp.]|nr:hypothetical protein [Pedobacter sp.]